MESEGAHKFNKCLFYILILLMVLTGSINTIFNKILQKSNSLGKLFEMHHWFITYGMFLGEFFSFIIYIYIKCTKNKSKEDIAPGSSFEEKEKGNEPKKKPKVPTNLIFVITAGLDLLASTLNTFALTYLAASIFQMMRSLELFFVCLWSRIILHNQIYNHHLLGVASLILGLILIGLNAFLYNNDNVSKNPLIGIILSFFVPFFSSAEYIFQEKFIKHYDVHPCQIVGFEGLWGIIIYTIMLIIFQNISCDNWDNSLKEGICSADENEKYHIEDSLFAFRQMLDNNKILIIYSFFVISVRFL